MCCLTISQSQPIEIDPLDHWPNSHVASAHHHHTSKSPHSWASLSLSPSVMSVFEWQYVVLSNAYSNLGALDRFFRAQSVFIALNTSNIRITYAIDICGFNWLCWALNNCEASKYIDSNIHRPSGPSLKFHAQNRPFFFFFIRIGFMFLGAPKQLSSSNVYCQLAPFWLPLLQIGFVWIHQMIEFNIWFSVTK